MSLGLIKPGMLAASGTKIHPMTGEVIEPLYVRADGSVVWPVLGGAEPSDDPNDPAYTGEDDEEDDEEEDDEDEDDDKSSKSKKRPAKKSKSSDDDDDEDEEDDKPTRPERQAARYRVERNQARKALAETNARLKALEDKDKPKDEVAAREAKDAVDKADKLAAKVRAQTLELAFFRASDIDWINPAHALKLVELDEVDVDEDGTVDERQLRRALRALAKDAPHLVKKPTKGSADKDDDTDEDDEEPRSRRQPQVNGSRKGSRKTADRAALAKRFPVLGR